MNDKEILEEYKNEIDSNIQKYYQENGDQLLQVNSFNKSKWSRY